MVSFCSFSFFSLVLLRFLSFFIVLFFFHSIVNGNSCFVVCCMPALISLMTMNDFRLLLQYRLMCGHTCLERDGKSKRCSSVFVVFVFVHTGCFLKQRRRRGFRVKKNYFIIIRLFFLLPIRRGEHFF